MGKAPRIVYTDSETGIRNIDYLRITQSSIIQLYFSQSPIQRLFNASFTTCKSMLEKANYDWATIDRTHIPDNANLQQ